MSAPARCTARSHAERLFGSGFHSLFASGIASITFAVVIHSCCNCVPITFTAARASCGVMVASYDRVSFRYLMRCG